MKKLETSEIPTKSCECDVLVMSPERISFDADYTHICENCKGGITYQMNDNYNQYFGFSGYDEYNDEPVERIFDNE
jgi:hypothetical protein